MGTLFGIILIVCFIPILLIMFLILYPKNWKNSKLIFGVSTRKEYTVGETAETVGDICLRRRRQAAVILLACFAVSLLSLFISSFVVLSTGSMIFILMSVVGIYLPFFLGNKEMKSLKKRLGIGEEKKVTLTDFKNAGMIRTLKPIQVILPVICCFVILLISLLIDFKVIPVNNGVGGTFICTGSSGVFLLTEFILIAAAYLMDGLKNEVISSDSVINANYNRAKKKNMSDFTVKMMWIHTFLIAGFLVFNAIWYSEIAILIFILIYFIILLTGVLVFISRDKRIESRYMKEVTVAEDEDDYWVGGLFYYNRNNKRLLVKKRIGIGGTMNFAHPAGKVIGVFIALIFMFSMGMMVYVGIASETPIKLQIVDEKIICHHLSDDYTINLDSVKDIILVKDIDSLKFIKIAGYGMDNLLKGSFSVNGEGGCKVFLNPQNGSCIKIVTDSATYYLGGETAEETEDVFLAVSRQLKQ